MTFIRKKLVIHINNKFNSEENCTLHMTKKKILMIWNCFYSRSV